MDNDSGGGLEIRPAVFYLLLGSVFTGGAGLTGALAPQLERSAVDACFTSSGSALEISAANTSKIARLDDRIAEAARDRFTGEDALVMRRAMDRSALVLENRIALLERQVEDLRRRERNGE